MHKTNARMVKPQESMLTAVNSEWFSLTSDPSEGGLSSYKPSVVRATQTGRDLLLCYWSKYWSKLWEETGAPQEHYFIYTKWRSELERPSALIWAILGFSNVEEISTHLLLHNGLNIQLYSYVWFHCTFEMLEGDKNAVISAFAIRHLRLNISKSPGGESWQKNKNMLLSLFPRLFDRKLIKSLINLQ